MVDRENLLEALILGERDVLTPEAAQQVLEGLRTGYQVTQPLEDYFHQMQEVFAANDGFQLCETPADLMAIITDFERGFQERGVATRRLACRLV